MKYKVKIRIAVVSVALLLLIGACKYFKHNTDGETLVMNYPMLDSAKLFDYEKAKAFAPTADAIVYARKIYLNAIDLSVNKKNPKESLPLFIQSLRFAPQAFTYFKYADALYDAGMYQDAISAYHMSHYFDQSNTPDAFMGIARSYAMAGDTTQAIQYLDYAMEKYPYDVEAIRIDKGFDRIKNMEDFTILLTKYSNTEEDRTSALFALFEKNFAKSSLPYNIPPDSVAVHTGRQIDFRYADFVDGMSMGKFSRSVQRDYQYMAALPLPGDFKTFVYRVVDFNGDTLYPVHQYIMTVDQNDTVIASQEIACSCTPLTIKTATVDSTGLIEVKEIMQTWKEDPREKGYSGNEVVKQEVKAKTYYQIAADGKINETKEHTGSGPAEADNSPKP